jgi:hypothetical protein
VTDGSRTAPSDFYRPGIRGHRSVARTSSRIDRKKDRSYSRVHLLRLQPTRHRGRPRLRRAFVPQSGQFTRGGDEGRRVIVDSPGNALWESLREFRHPSPDFLVGLQCVGARRLINRDEDRRLLVQPRADPMIARRRRFRRMAVCCHLRCALEGLIDTMLRPRSQRS